MLRFEVSEEGQAALPAIDIADEHVVVGSGPRARIRVPAQAARDEHVRITHRGWLALSDVVIDGTSHAARDEGLLGGGITIELGRYRVRVRPAPAGASASPPQRTESLARELVRSLLGDGASPTLEVERGPVVGAKRMLPPPEATVVIGRGDEATWVILDEDLSRTHAEVRRGWDGVSIRDLGSKNGTRVHGKPAATATPLRDGALVELGTVVLRFRDPAERHLRAGDLPAAAPTAAPPPAPAPGPWPFVIAAVIAGIAIVGLVWILTG